MSADEDSLYFEQLPKLVCDPHERHFGGANVDLFSRTKQLVTLSSF